MSFIFQYFRDFVILPDPVLTFPDQHGEILGQSDGQISLVCCPVSDRCVFPVSWGSVWTLYHQLDCDGGRVCANPATCDNSRCDKSAADEGPTCFTANSKKLVFPPRMPTVVTAV